MSKTSVIAILAAAGIVLAGPVSVDAMALAKAIEEGSRSAFVQFLREHPDSRFVSDAIILASTTAPGKSGDSASGVSGTPGNQGQGRDDGRGNAGGDRPDNPGST
jgi:hypothetical protein